MRKQFGGEVGRKKKRGRGGGGQHLVGLFYLILVAFPSLRTKGWQKKLSSGQATSSSNHPLPIFSKTEDVASLSLELLLGEFLAQFPEALLILLTLGVVGGRLPWQPKQNECAVMVWEANVSGLVS